MNEKISGWIRTTIFQLTYSDFTVKNFQRKCEFNGSKCGPDDCLFNPLGVKLTPNGSLFKYLNSESE